MFVITCILISNIFLSKRSFCQELTTIQSEQKSFVTPLNVINVSSTITITNNDTIDKNAVKIERAVLPVSQTQQILTTTEFQNSTKVTKTQNDDLKQFRPSPQLETYYEFNKIPVQPVIGEAKLSNNVQGGENYRAETLPWEPPNQPNPGLGTGTSWSVNPPWVKNTRNPSEQSRPWNHQDSTSESPWVNRVKFPSTRERPYSFVTNQQQNGGGVGQGNSQQYLPPSGENYVHRPGNDNNNKYLSPVKGNNNNNNYLPPIEANQRNNYIHSTSHQEQPFAFNKLVEVPKRTPQKLYDYPTARQPTWEKYGGDKDASYSTSHKETYDYNLLEKPAPSHEKTYDSSSYGVSDGSYGFNPIKKILKLLATFIPIGLLISALTPTVITVTNVNDTDTDIADPMRYRSEDSRKVLAQHVISSLSYFDKLKEQGCEYRVFCELLISASNMKDSEQHVENLLSNFSSQDQNLQDKADELKEVFDAVKRQDCSPIRCKYLKGPS